MVINTDIVAPVETQVEPETTTQETEIVFEKPIPYTFYTPENELVNVYPIGHATVVIEWGDKTIYIDPAEALEKYELFAEPDLIFITHIHGDHLQAPILEELYSL
jgi:glyoxylase-like metal-dependent hydrolase (beta-lactamase superfamily II)